MKMITPEQLAACGTEHGHQTALFCWAALPETRAQWPEIALMFAIPNGGERNKATAARLKAEGVKPGVSDILLPVGRGGYFGLFIEMKKPKRGVVSDAQFKFGEAIREQGYDFSICRDWEAARTRIINYLAQARTIGFSGTLTR